MRSHNHIRVSNFKCKRTSCTRLFYYYTQSSRYINKTNKLYILLRESLKLQMYWDRDSAIWNVVKSYRYYILYYIDVNHVDNFLYYVCVYMCTYLHDTNLLENVNCWIHKALRVWSRLYTHLQIYIQCIWDNSVNNFQFLQRLTANQQNGFNDIV